MRKWSWKKAGGLLSWLSAVSASAACPEPVSLPLDVRGSIHRSTPGFTEGLIFFKGALLESTGLYGSSSLQKINPRSGQVDMLARLPEEVFGEGLSEWNGLFLELTWHEHVVFIKKGDPGAPWRTRAYPWDGWGITHDSSDWIASDGSSALRFLERDQLAARRTITVRRKDSAGRDREQKGLNELEYVEGKILANVFPGPEIVRIDPKTGCVDGVLDTTPLYTPSSDPESVANGIAYDPATRTLFLTGKNWSSIFLVTPP